MSFQTQQLTRATPPSQAIDQPSSYTDALTLETTMRHLQTFY